MIDFLCIKTTMRCDLKCEHCANGFPENRLDFPIELLDKLLVEALPFGASHVALTGGESYLHPQFGKMVDTIVRYGYEWHFVSNGQHTEPYLPLLQKYRDKVTHVTLSIDGATARTHDDIRERKGAFERVTTAAREYVAAGFLLKINSSLNQKNKSEVQGLITLADELGATELKLGGTIPAPWNGHLVLSDEESFEIYEQVNTLREKTKLKIKTTSNLYTRGGVNFCSNLNLHGISINSRGQLIFCCDTINEGAVIGSLREHSFSKLVELWLEKSAALQRERTKQIANGNMNAGYDTCAFCNQYLFAD
jgi:MoaA/NifB/PqqE/SkfB family radical SAM enzyme